MVDSNTVIEGSVKFRDGKKWKSRWCVMRKLSPVADCLHLQLYRDSKERYKQGHTKASLSLQHFLAIETGFTLDKESNTIGIICQDVTVILAFDTRERLIQWQVKIVNNLGDDQQFLIQITSAPPRAKIPTGPAHLHVQDQRFCLTTGVPPRLLGFWEINQLRRYGVVEGRFVFEGGSRCGKGEGVHVCVTDQGEEITKTFELAAQGKVGSRRRPVARNMSVMDSPRRQLHSRASDAESLQQSMLANQMMAGDYCGDDTSCPCRSHHESGSPFWMSTESSATGMTGNDVDSNYGCGDASSVCDSSDHHLHHSNHHHHHQFHQQIESWSHTMSSSGTASRSAPSSTLERCASCISKLGAPSLSRSSTATTTYPNTPAAGVGIPFNPAWTMDHSGGVSAEQCHQRHFLHAQSVRSNSSSCDCMSVSSHGSVGSSSGTNSEYCVPRLANEASWYDRPSTPHHQPPPVPLIPPKSPKLQPGAAHVAQPNSNAGLPPPNLSHPIVGAKVPTSSDQCRCQCFPPSRPPKPSPSCSVTDSPSKKKIKKPPMPLPLVTQQPTSGNQHLGCACPHHPQVALLKQQHRADMAQCAPFENYDVPKSLLGNNEVKEDGKPKDSLSRSSFSNSVVDEYYDTPKNIKESLTSGGEQQQESHYGNYDIPPSVKTLRKPCGCVIKLSKKSVFVTSLIESSKLVMEHDDSADSSAASTANCPCQKVMCWAENWMMLPYCRRGNGIENTGVPIHKVKLSGEGKMPVMNTSGKIAIYATIDKTKKANKKNVSGTGSLCNHSPCTCSRNEGDGLSVSNAECGSLSNYVNVEIDPENGSSGEMGKLDDVGGCQTDANYENIDFAQSLEYYENAKDVLSRAGLSQPDAEVDDDDGDGDESLDGSQCPQMYSVNNGVKVCNKCGHECHMYPQPSHQMYESSVETYPPTLTESMDSVRNSQDDYLMMEPGKVAAACSKPDGGGIHSSNPPNKNFPGYLPMSPITSGSTTSKSELMRLRAQHRGLCNLSAEKSASIPSLSGPIAPTTIDMCCKRSEIDYPRVPGSAMLMYHSAAKAPYFRQRLNEPSCGGEDRRHQLPCRKRSSSADSRYVDGEEDSEKALKDARSNRACDSPRHCAPSSLYNCEVKTEESTAALQSEGPQGCGDDRLVVPDAESSEDTKEDTPDDTSARTVVHVDSFAGRDSHPPQQQQHTTATATTCSSVHIRRSSSVPCKSGNNRDSSSSNDSGVSTGSLKTRGGDDFAEFELPLTTSQSARKQQHHYNNVVRHAGYLTNCVHGSLPRRSKSVDPLRDITFQFQKIKVPAKSSSAEAEVPICPKNRGFQSPGGESAPAVPYMDSRSTSSGTSDMSDYIETLSVSSHSSSDVQDAILLGRQATTTLRPRSGKEYQLIDRSILDGDVKGDKSGHHLRGLGAQYANITPVPEKSESPSPGYMSGSPGQEREDQPLILHPFPKQ